MLTSSQILKKKNKPTITTRSHALSLKAQGTIKLHQFHELRRQKIDDLGKVNYESEQKENLRNI